MIRRVSRAPPRARGLKLSAQGLEECQGCRAPPRARGLKQRPTRRNLGLICRAPPRARGLKHPIQTNKPAMPSRAPPRARGLKPAIDSASTQIEIGVSRPPAGAWIETTGCCRGIHARRRAKVQESLYSANRPHIKLERLFGFPQ